MAAKLRVGIVGAGIIGCASAFELARHGADVRVIDMRAPGAGATQASAGVLAPFIEGHSDATLLQLVSRGLDAYDDFVESVRAAVSADFEYRLSGSVEVADSEDRSELLQSRVEQSSETGLFQWLDAAQLRECEPAVRPAQFGGLLCRAHGYVAVTPFVATLVRAAERYGATFSRGTVVRVRLESHRCVLETENGDSDFDRIVLSTGSWASLLDPLGEIRDAIKPIRGQLVELSWRGPRIEHVLWGSSCYVVPWRDGTLLVGATSEDVGFDEHATVEGVMGLLNAARGLLLDLDAAVFRGVRVGLRPASASGLPLIGPSVADPRVVYATGHFRNGVLLAPLSATIIASYLLEGKQDPAFRLKNGA